MGMQYGHLLSNCKAVLPSASKLPRSLGRQPVFSDVTDTLFIDISTGAAPPEVCLSWGLLPRILQTVHQEHAAFFSQQVKQSRLIR